MPAYFGDGIKWKPQIIEHVAILFVVFELEFVEIRLIRYIELYILL